MSTYNANRDKEYMSTYNAERNKTIERKTEKAAYDAARNAKHKKICTQARTDKAKITRKKKRAASKDKGSKIFDQSRQDAANAECETLGAFRNA